MAITSLTNKQTYGINFTVKTDSSVDWSGVTNDTYFYDIDTDLCYYKDGSGVVKGIFDSGSAGGKVAIYDSNGIPTFYSTIQDAVAVGGLIHIFADINTTSTINIVPGTSINLNGFTITMSNDDATNLITFLGAAAYVGRPFYNGTLKRTGRALNSTGTVIRFNLIFAHTDIIDWAGVSIINDYGVGIDYGNSNIGSDFTNLNLDTYGRGINLVGFNYRPTIVKNSIIKTNSGVCVGGATNEFIVENSILSSINDSTTSGSILCRNSLLSSVTGIAAALSVVLYNCIVRSGSNWGTHNSSAFNSIITSSSSYGVNGMGSVQDCNIKSITSSAVRTFGNYTQLRGIIESKGSSDTLEHTGESRFFNLTGVTVINSGTGNGVGGLNENSVYKNCDFIIADGTKNAISTGTTPRWMQCNFSANLTNPTAALVNAQVNTADNYGNIQEG